MYCTNCGKEATGNFCASCGKSTQNSNSKPQYKKVLLLILLFYVVASGQYYGHYEPLNNACFYALIDTLVATILLTSYPFFTRLINKSPIEYSECKKICMANSIILFIISLIMYAHIKVGFIGGLGALVFYYINMALFSEPKKQDVVRNQKLEDIYVYNPKLSDIDNLKVQFSKMDIELLKDLIENKKTDYTEEAYSIALEQYKLRFHELQNSQRIAELKDKISQFDEALLSLNQMLEQAKKDLGNLTIEDAENMYRQKLISETQKDEMINSIEALQFAIATTPQNIISTQKTKVELEEELRKLQEV